MRNGCWETYSLPPSTPTALPRSPDFSFAVEPEEEGQYRRALWAPHICQERLEENIRERQDIVEPGLGEGKDWLQRSGIHVRDLCVWSSVSEWGPMCLCSSSLVDGLGGRRQ